jgi:hypothetical protein
MKIPQGFEKHFPAESNILLLKYLYGLKYHRPGFKKQLMCKDRTAKYCIYM